MIYDSGRVPTCRTDAGRVTEGFAQERNDCAVRCLATAHNMPYRDAHELFSMAGRKDGKGSSIWHIRQACGTTEKRLESKVSVARFIREHSKGTFMVHIRSHIFCLKDGVCYDLGVNRPLARVDFYWEVV